MLEERAERAGKGISPKRKRMERSQGYLGSVRHRLRFGSDTAAGNEQGQGRLTFQGH